MITATRRAIGSGLRCRIQASLISLWTVMILLAHRIRREDEYFIISNTFLLKSQEGRVGTHILHFQPGQAAASLRAVKNMILCKNSLKYDNGNMQNIQAITFQPIPKQI